MLKNRRATFLRYGTAVAATAAALGLRLLLVPLVTQDAPFLLFFASVLVSAVRGGFGPGLLATLLAALCNNYFFMMPFGEWGGTADQFLRLAMFVVEGVFISLICARLLASRKAVEDSAAEASILERRILEISEAEQRRIGHDLHDGLGQHLTGIALLVRRLHNRLTAHGSSEAADVEKLAALTTTAVAWTHDLCRSLSPAALESSGITQGLRELAANAESLFSIKCNFEADDEQPAVNLESASHLYRIAQEAISNAVRHGKATVVELRLQTNVEGTLIEISDNGSGLGDAATGRVDGMGLRIMRYRAKMIGADVNVRPRPGNTGGTIVTCKHVAPVTAAAATDTSTNAATR